MENIIIAENIFKNYSETNILNNVSLFIKKGEILAIIGASGAGKTTLLQILGTLENCSDPIKNKSRIEINGKSILNLSDKKLSKLRNTEIGFVFQNNQLLPEFTAEENVAISAMLNGLSLKDAKIKAIEILKKLGLEHRLTHKPSELSGGEQQRVAIARAMINSPSIIFADEPSGNLDFKTAEELHNIILNLNKNFGVTFVIVTHNSDLANLADRQLTMKNGEIIP